MNCNNEKLDWALCLIAAICFAWGAEPWDIAHHDAQPHVEPELRSFAPSTLPNQSLGDSSERIKSLGLFRWNTFYRRMLWANKLRSRTAMLNAYVDTAREISARYPDLKPWERGYQYSCFKSQIDRTRRRTSHDYSAALPAIAQALGVPHVCFQVAASLLQNS
jgi:hypothetical protein